MEQHTVRTTLRSLFPPGDEDLYAFENPTSWVARELEAVATAVRLHGTDAVDRLRQEVRPHTATEKLADWERIFGTTETSTARYGAVAARRGQVLARWREHGASTVENIRAALAAVLGYQPDVIEQSRTALTRLNSYAPTGIPLAIPAGPGSLVASIVVADSAPASSAGARLTLVISHVALEELSVTLTAPTGAPSVALPLGSGIAVQRSFTFTVREFARAAIDGAWALTIANAGANPGTIHTGTQLFVEGIGRGPNGAEGRGANIFEWAVLVDDAQLGAVADLAAARALVPRWNPAHARGYFCRRAAGAGGGGAAGVFDDPNSIFEESIFGV